MVSSCVYLFQYSRCLLIPIYYQQQGWQDGLNSSAVFLKVGHGNILVGHEDSELINQYMIAFIALHFQICKKSKDIWICDISGFVPMQHIVKKF